MGLARFFAWLDRLLGTAPAGHESGFVSRPVAPATMLPAARELLPRSALLSVDGAGQFLLCGAERLTLGHLRAGRADLGFLADVGALHATIVRADSLHTGPGWRIEPCGGERVSVAEQEVPASGRRIAPGERVRLGENLEFALELSDPASASAVLVLQRGAECAGARRIVLLAPGRGGRVRVGAALRHHVRVPGLDFELSFEWRGNELEIESELPLEGALQGERGSIPFPPRARLAFTCGRPRGSRPPFGLSIEPVYRERGRGGDPSPGRP
jgi:hypothetical protein